jgi:hypothetical protein
MRLTRAARLLISLGVLVVVAALLFFVVFPAGASTAVTAAAEKVQARADTGTVKVLITRKWGGGELVLMRFDRHGVRMLRLAFASHGTRGWRAAGATEKRADLTDVAVGSLLVARSPGGKGQPPWSVAAGELGDKRIEHIEVRWSGAPATDGSRENDSYLVVRRGTAQVTSVRFSSKDSTEIATVPVSAA